LIKSGFYTGEMQMEGRHRLDEQDKEILNDIKQQMTIAIEKLVERNVRHANIEIELLWHIRDTLKGEVDY
jgi:hypothetical protein